MQIIIFVFILVVLLKTIRRLQEKQITAPMFGLWLILWLGVAVITYQPEIINRLANWVGVGRGSDLVVYVALLAVFYLLFRIFVKIEAVEKRLSRLVRERLKEFPALTLLTPEQPELSSGMVSFALDERKGRKGEIVGRLYEEHNIVSKPAQGTYAYAPEKDLPRENYNALRFSTHIFNNEKQIERTVEILAGMLA